MFKRLTEQLQKFIQYFEINENELQKLFIAEPTPEAIEQLKQLEEPYKGRITEAIKVFEVVGTKYKNLNDLGNGLFEIKPKDVRAYFRYHPDRRRIIIVGFICLKKTQKAPKQNIEQANKNIQRYIDDERTNNGQNN